MHRRCQAIGLSFAGVFMSHAVFAQDRVDVVDKPDTQTVNSHYVGSRAPLLPTPLLKLPAGVVHPQGWLLKQLELQADGFHGHLGEISRFLKKDGNAWLHPDKDSHAGWEELPYWLKGYINAAYLLEREDMITEAKVWVEAVIEHAQPDGWFGPLSNRTSLKGKPDLWPNMIMLFCLQDYYDFTGDQRVIALMSRYFESIMSISDPDFLPGYWDTMRGGDLLYSVYWLYNRTGNTQLLELAAKVHRNTARWDTGIVNWHNVNMAQAFGEPTTYYLQSIRESDLKASYRNFDEFRTAFGQVPGGLFGGDENCRPGYTGPRQAVETCGMVEMMLSAETLVWITGDPVWADRCEDVAFNSLPAALTADMKALRYLTAPNMPLSDAASKSPELQNSGPMLLMNPHIHRCCQHNMGHGWPYFIEHLWYATPDNGLAAVFYSANDITAGVGNGKGRVTFHERTHYPFDERITFTAEIDSGKNAFPLYLRVPGWCTTPAVKINGKPHPVDAKPDSYIRIERAWANGDTVELTLPMTVSLRTWTANHNSVSVDRGPLTYSLKIGEKYVRKGGTDAWPAWEIHPTTPWNYGLILDPNDATTAFKAVTRAWPDDDMPFTEAGTPVVLKARGKRIPAWQLDELGLVGSLQDSPVAAGDEPAEDITLIPMGAARLRISAFPVVGTGPDAHTWIMPPKPLYKTSASHCHNGDSLRALCDERLPKNSNDHGIPRMTWWDHRGTREWVQYDFNEPRTVAGVEVYWFDDTGVGQCRVPKSWEVLYKTDDGAWAPAPKAIAGATAPDTFNRVTFAPVKTTALRLNVELQSGFSGGILEWRVIPTP